MKTFGDITHTLDLLGRIKSEQSKLYERILEDCSTEESRSVKTMLELVIKILDLSEDYVHLLETDKAEV